MTSAPPPLGGPVAAEAPKPDSAQDLFTMCRSDDWEGVHRMLVHYPNLALTPMVMINNIATTVLHQAITSKGDVQQRANVIRTILNLTPDAASRTNGYGSLPLHVVAQRNTRMDARTKEGIILALIRAHPEALTTEGGVGKRTPLHIVFTDYVSLKLVKAMIGIGPEATFMKDKKGWLPVHVACSRHCSPQKLQLLLRANPASLLAETKEGKSLLWLARSTATKSHPNNNLIQHLEVELALREKQKKEKASPQCPRQPSPKKRAYQSSQSSHSSHQSTPDQLSDTTPVHVAKRPALSKKVSPERVAKQPRGGSKIDEQDETLANLLLHFHGSHA